MHANACTRSARQYHRQDRENPDVHNPGVWMHRRVDCHCSDWSLRAPRRREHRRGRRHQRTARPRTDPSQTFPRKFAVAEWGSRKINPNKICAECWTGAAFGPYWLLTERLRYETTPLLPAPRDRAHVHGQRDDALAAIAEAIQPQATAGQLAQADTTTSDAGDAEDGASKNAPAADASTNSNAAAPPPTPPKSTPQTPTP